MMCSHTGFAAISHRIHVWYINANIGGILMVNVTIYSLLYSIHGSYGFEQASFNRNSQTVSVNHRFVVTCWNMAMTWVWVQKKQPAKMHGSYMFILNGGFHSHMGIFKIDQNSRIPFDFMENHTHMIHGAAIYGNMDPIKIPPVMLALIYQHHGSVMGYEQIGGSIGDPMP